MTEIARDESRAQRLERIRSISREQARRFMRVRKAEHAYGRALRAVAHQIGLLVSGFQTGSFSELRETLRRYADILDPWARTVAQRMIEDVNRRDLHAWLQNSREIGAAQEHHIRNAPIGEVMSDLMAEQVTLIKSLPLDAAQRVHKYVIEGLSHGERAAEAAKKILETGRVTKSHAMLIARTETTRVATALLQARAQHIGSDAYIWRSAEDEDVRPLHRKLNGTIQKWSEPPIAGERGERAHPGMIYNCRCYAEPILPAHL